MTIKKLIFIFVFCGCYAYAAQQHRPFRAGIIKFNREIDKIKPLATADLSGWVLSKNCLIGTVDDEVVVCFSHAEKKILWWHKESTSLTTPITVNPDGSAFLGFRDGKVVKINTDDGKVLWHTTLDSFSNRAVTVSGKTALILTAGQQLYALDYNSGSTQWLYDAGFPEQLTIRGAPPPLVDGSTVYIGVASGDIQAINLTSGKQLWSMNPEYTQGRFHDVTGEMYIINKRLLVVRYDGFIGSIDVENQDRKTIWKDQLPSISAIAYRDGRIYVGGVNGDVYSYDAVTGTRVWRAETAVTLSAIVIGERLLYLAGANGRIIALQWESGALEWYDDIGGEIASKPFILNDNIYFGTGLKVLYSYKLN